MAIVSYAAIFFCSISKALTWKQNTGKINKTVKMVICCYILLFTYVRTRIVAVWDWQLSSKYIISLSSCFTWSPLLWFISFIRAAAILNAFLLHKITKSVRLKTLSFVTGFNQEGGGRLPFPGFKASAKHILLQSTGRRRRRRDN